MKQEPSPWFLQFSFLHFLRAPLTADTSEF